MAYAAVRGARSRPAAPARRDDGVDVASRDRVLAVAAVSYKNIRAHESLVEIWD
ncbi:hypothetical protein QVL82_17570 [Cellulosimicrobium funkei]|uniref:hypothetical protein n=1 Tax=Cellulosimicrobium funkei TaxID=264251 RepID=UPI003758380C